MGFHNDFPISPYAILLPEIRWFPGDMTEDNDILIPPLVTKIREGVRSWRDNNYKGASNTTISLLNYWFKTTHSICDKDGLEKEFIWYFSQREAVESVIWLYEVEKIKDPLALMKYDSSEMLMSGHFSQENVGDWTRYVMKMATGAGKTKVLSLLIAWSYFHKFYEQKSDLSSNFLLIAPNIIVLERLKVDFENLKIFYNDPILPDNGFDNKNWQDDFNMNYHFQDDNVNVSDIGNLFLTNIHRIYIKDDDLIDDRGNQEYFLGIKPTGNTLESKVNLENIIKAVPDLVILNDEAHHIHDSKLAWFQSIRSISDHMKKTGRKLSAQFDVTATPRHEDKSIFSQTISDYPLVEAIRQGIVKIPVLPDQASRSKLKEIASSEFTEKYQDYIHLGYLEWKKSYDKCAEDGKKGILFIMTEDIKSCDNVKTYLEATYPELINGILVIHTKMDGNMDEGKFKDIDILRKQSREIDGEHNIYKVVISVLMLREGWDVSNVTTIVGLRPFSSKSKILPEQTLGRGLRKMFKSPDVPEWLSVIGTEPFMEFVESIKDEGVIFEYEPMGIGTRIKAPGVVYVDAKNHKNDLASMDIDVPILSAREKKRFKRLDELHIDINKVSKVPIKEFSEAEKREIIFLDMNTDSIDHVVSMDTVDLMPIYSDGVNVVSYFRNQIMRDLHMVHGGNILYEKIKLFMEYDLFIADSYPVDITDLNIIRNLSIPVIRKTIEDVFKDTINSMSEYTSGTTEIYDTIKLSDTKSFAVNDKFSFVARKSIFNKVVCDNQFEFDFAKFLDKCEDIISFSKIYRKMGFSIEYVNEDGNIANYYPDFLVKSSPTTYFLIELKGREDLDDLRKKKRGAEWCADATSLSETIIYTYIYIKEDLWKKYRASNFQELSKINLDT